MGSWASNMSSGGLGHGGNQISPRVMSVGVLEGRYTQVLS